MSSLLGVDDKPGQLNGAPIPAPLARVMAHRDGTTWRRLVTDPIGRIRDISVASYTPPAAMARFVQLRDPRCVFPTCQVADRWKSTATANRKRVADRGDNSECRGGGLAGRWWLKKLPDGAVRWRTPTGRTYDKPPPDPLPVDTTSIDTTGVDTARTDTNTATPAPATAPACAGPPPF